MIKLLCFFNRFAQIHALQTKAEPSGIRQIIAIRTAIWVAVFMTLGGCDDASMRPDTQVLGKVQVVASVQPLADVVAKVGGDQVQSTWIIEAGQSPAGRTLADNEKSRFRRADLLVHASADDGWIVDALGGELELRGRIIRLDVLESTRLSTSGGNLWTDPRVACQLAEAVAERLSTLRPADALRFQTNAADFKSRVDQLLTNSPVLTRTLICTSPDVTPLLKRLNINFHVSPIDPASFTPSDVNQLIDAANKLQATTLIINQDFPQGLSDTISQRTGLTIRRLQVLGSSASGQTGDYLEALRLNISQLHDSLED